MISITLTHLATVARSRGDDVEAQRYAEESLAVAREVDSPDKVIDALLLLGQIAQRHGDRTRALRCYRESMDCGYRLRDISRIARRW